MERLSEEASKRLFDRAEAYIKEQREKRSDLVGEAGLGLAYGETSVALVVEFSLKSGATITETFSEEYDTD